MSLALLILSAAASLFAIGKCLLRPLVDRAGDRLAEWLLPAERVWTYRLARAIARLCEAIAPTDSDTASSESSAVGSAIEGVRADIDEIELGDRGGARLAISLAWSLVRPALRARLFETMRWLGFVLFGAPIYMVACIGSKAAGAKPSDDMPDFAPQSRALCVAIMVGANLAAAVGATFGLRVFPVVVVGVFGWAALHVVFADVMAVVEFLHRRKWLRRHAAREGSRVAHPN
jgi:hypothetical protein